MSADQGGDGFLTRETIRELKRKTFAVGAAGSGN
jgi:hypothetical protein